VLGGGTLEYLQVFLKRTKCIILKFPQEVLSENAQQGMPVSLSLVLLYISSAEVTLW
jgi:hypothetical protein